MDVTIDNLRREQNKVRVLHHRLLKKDVWLSKLNSERDVLLSQVKDLEEKIAATEAMEGGEVSPVGGFTIVEITTPEGTELKGMASCSVSDAFNKKIGSKIALGRALTSLGTNG